MKNINREDFKMPNNMTEGRPIRQIVLFAIPVLLGNLFQQLYNVVDSIIVGRYIGVDALAAVGSTGALIFLVFGWIIGMTNGFSIMIAQSYGAGDFKRLRQFAALSFVLCAIMAVVMTIGLLWANGFILRLMQTPEEVFKDTYNYIGIMYAGLAITVFYNMYAGMLRAIGDSRTPLYFLAIASVLHIILDIVFINVFSMGVEGAAYATIVSEFVSLILCVWYTTKKYEIFRMEKEDFAIDGSRIWKLLTMGVPMALQFSVTAIGTMIVQAALNGMGPLIMASYSVAGKIQSLVSQPYVALGATMATYVGQNRGAGKIARVRDGVKQGTILAVSFSILSAAIIFFFGDVLIIGFISEDVQNVTKTAMIYFRTVLWFYPFLSMIFIYRNSLQGLGDGLMPMIGGLLELAARVVVIYFVADRLGYQGICMADPFAWILVSVALIPVYYKRIATIQDYVLHSHR